MLNGRAYHFIDGISNAKTLLKGLNTKVESLKTRGGELIESAEAQGIMEDFVAQSKNLNDEFQKLDDFFDNSLSKKELNFINKLKLVNDSLGEFNQRLETVKIDEALNGISDGVKQSDQTRTTLTQFFADLDRSIEEIGKSVKSIDENTKKKISANLNAINTLEEEFCEKHKASMEKFLDSQNKNFQTQIDTQKESYKQQVDTQKEQLDSILTHINKIKKSLFIFIGIVVFMGFLCGAFSLLAFSKYKEFKDIESRFNTLSEKLNSVKILKNNNNDVVLSIPKTATINSNGNEHIINLGGGK